jgi:4'-phosphopantetheinyl transferase
MKEAYIKAVGIGLGFELQRAEFHYQDGNIWSNVAHVRIDGVHKAKWQFFLHSLDDKHWVSLDLKSFVAVDILLFFKLPYYTFVCC